MCNLSLLGGFMKCKYCETEHPEGQIANPHYCIARLVERNESLKSLMDGDTDWYAIAKKAEEEIEKLKHIHSQHTLSIEHDEAREQGTEIISYDELLGMLEG